jgi:hypothetical protein
MKLQDKKVKAVIAVNEIKAIQARQEEVKALFEVFDASEVKVQEALMNFKKSETVLQSCQAFRVACVAVVEALKDKVFTSQKEVATELKFDKNKMSRIVKCGKVFQKFTSEELEAQGLNELDIKALSHDDPKVITNLLEDGAEVAEAKEAKDEAKAKAPSKKFEKAVETVIELLADTSLSAEVRFDAYRRIETQAGNQMKEEMKQYQAKKLEAYRQLIEGKKVKANA